MSKESLLTKLNTISFSQGLSFELLTLKDRNQFYDPHGRAERLGITSALWPLFGMIWPAGVLLANEVLSQSIEPDTRVLEIGCGLALASLVAHSQSLQVTASDYHPKVPEFLRRNLLLNNLPILPYRYGRWGDDDVRYRIDDMGAMPIYQRYDLIIGSDLLYEPDSAFFVARYIDSVAMPSAEVWVVDPNRGYKNRFSRELQKHGFEAVEERLVERDDGYTLNNVMHPVRGYFLRFKR